ncbi:MAG: hypothetical protein LBN04_02035 [Oscillospiraceae bacterium]|nr:hypothetical protein [Oscillospiraceae bacterium]
MKRSIYILLLAIEAVFLVALTSLRIALSGAVLPLLAFPFEPIARGLRALSLSGAVGNIAALALLALPIIACAAVLGFKKRRGRLKAEDSLLGILCATLIAALYLMINPSDTGQPASLRPAIHGILGGAVYSVLCGYLVLRALRLFQQSDASGLMRYMSILLGAIGALFVYMAAGARFSALLSALDALRMGNIGNESALALSRFILVLGYVVDALPYALNIWIILAAMRLLGELRADRYSEASVAATARVSRLCGNTLKVCALLSLTYNCLQVLLIRLLRVVNVTVSIPLLPIAFTLAALLITRFIAENKRLKDENDAFV